MPSPALRPDGGFKNIPVELYETGRGYAVFDAKKVVFLEVDEVVFAILGRLREEDLDEDDLASLLPRFGKRDVRESMDEIRELQKAGFLTPSPFRRLSRYDRSRFEEILSSRMSGFTVYVTTQCNLACSYCIYGGEYGRYEPLSQTPMSWETARRMLDFLVFRSRQSKTLRLDFFGGEPLMAFDLVRRSVEYAKSNIGSGGPEVSVTIASNGTILTDEILEFLLAHKVYLQFSIDGEKDVHDRERRFRNGGRGSYDLVLENLDRIHRRHPAYFREYIRIKSVMTMAAVGLEEDGFLEHPLIKAVEETGGLTVLMKEPHFDLAQDSDFFDQLHCLGRRLLERNGVKTLSDLLQPLPLRQRAFFHHTFAEFMEVQAVNKVLLGHSEEVPFRKGCLMGYQEGAVHPNGDISICHKATSFVVGNVTEGRWNFDRIWELHSLLHEEWPECESCLAQRFCDLCYEKLDGERGSWAEARARYCQFTRQKYHVVFEYMLRILDRNPELWTDLGRWVEERVGDKRK